MLAPMKPAEICMNILGKTKLEAILQELSVPQVKAILSEGDVKVKLPAGYASQQKRRQLWSAKILAAIEQGNQTLCAEMLQQWLLNHRRQLLIDFLDRLEVKHRHGETDESFLIARSADRIRAEAKSLLGVHDRAEAAAYLAYIAYQQKATVFDGWEELASGAEAPTTPEAKPDAPTPEAKPAASAPEGAPRA
jgi:hypothetical protein